MVAKAVCELERGGLRRVGRGRRWGEASELAEQRDLSDLERQGLIQAFEFTHELAWNTLKDFLTARGSSETLYGSRDATRAAYAAELIEDGEAWMEIHNQSSIKPHAAPPRGI